jgi:hypothetical protein
MNKKLLCLGALFLLSPAFAQSASEYISKVFNSSEIFGSDKQGFVKSAEVSCQTLRFHAGSRSVIIPTLSVSLALAKVNDASAVRFACINGGGCISGTADHGVNWIFFTGFTPEVTKSISNAFSALQESCGGAEKRPF